MVRNLCMLTVLALAGAAVADEMNTVRGLPYNGRITGFEGGVVSIEVNGNIIRRNIDDVAKLAITSQESFNDGEKALAAKKYADAVKAYDQAIDRVGEVEWLKQLTAVRRLKALGQAGMIDRAVTEWLALLEQTSNAKYALALVPTKVAAKGAKENADAIVALEAKEAALEKGSPALSGVRQLLLDLYQAQGDTAKGKALTDKMGSGKTTEGQGDDNTKPTVGRGGNLNDLVKAAEYNIGHGQAEQALTSLKGALQQFTPENLPKALLLMGKAQMELAKSAKDDATKKQLRLDAGLNFMRVATFYSTLPQAGEAMYLAGVVNRDLGNTRAARAAFNRVRDNYANTPFAAEASKEVDKLEASGPAPKKPPQ